MKKLILHVVFPILVGSIIYILFREKKLLMFKWFEFFNLNFIIDFMRDICYKYRKIIPKSLLFSLPDALWVYSFTMFLSFYFKNKIILSSIFVGSMITEIFQIWFVVGTFDTYDLIYMFIFYIISIYFIKKYEEEKKL